MTLNGSSRTPDLFVESKKLHKVQKSQFILRLICSNLDLQTSY